MRSMALIVCALTLTGLALAIAPAAEARSVCSDLVDDWCRAAVCLNANFCSRDLNPVCVTEPCWQPIP